MSDWVKASERLPKSDGRYLVVADGFLYVAGFARGLWGGLSEDQLDLITHWMPTPALPDESDTPKPCPFCGSEAVYDQLNIQVENLGRRLNHAYRCTNLLCCGYNTSQGCASREDALEAWNQRVY